MMQKILSLMLKPTQKEIEAASEVICDATGLAISECDYIAKLALQEAAKIRALETGTLDHG